MNGRKCYANTRIAEVGTGPPGMSGRGGAVA